MSAAAVPAAEGAPAPAKGKKKLLIIVVAALLMLAAAGGGAVVVMKKKAAAAAAEAEEDGHAAAETHAAKKHDPSQPPTFLPLEPFVVNLADKDADRYAQIGITLEVDDAKTGDQLKAYMPAIRNGILMVIAHKTSAQLLERAGKLQLADEIMREAARPLGIELDVPEAAAKDDEAHGDDEDAKPKKKKAKKKPAVDNPVRHVHFSNFIIQ